MITQLQSKEAIFIPQIGGIGLTVNQGSSGSKFAKAELSIIENAGVKVSVLKPGTNIRYYAIVPWGSIKAVTGSETNEYIKEHIQPAR